MCGEDRSLMLAEVLRHQLHLVNGAPQQLKLATLVSCAQAPLAHISEIREQASEVRCNCGWEAVAYVPENMFRCARPLPVQQNDLALIRYVAGAFDSRPAHRMPT
eukprot:14664582-Alexandrium_andersonii.AAC.1